MNILTIDLEDWFHILDVPSANNHMEWNSFGSRVEANSDRILEFLDAKNIRATWFCLGWIVNKYPGLIKKIAAKHELACHSVYHQLLFNQSANKTAADILENINALQDLTGRKVKAYRAPGFSFTNETKWLVEILNECGIEYDCSVFPVSRNHGGFSRFPVSSPCRINFNGNMIKEFPMNTATLFGKKFVFSGGGYFRFLPYLVINSYFKKSDYNMTYFHPRDFDPGQPLLPGLSIKRKFMSYTGLKKSFLKFNRLLNDHKFVTVEEAGLATDWNKTPLVQINNL